jgi:formate-dependent nitrite reductase membrane component NrfD
VSDDGRFINPQLGELTGEAALQRAPDRRRAEAGGAPAFDVRAGTPNESTTYYDRPVLKEPVWIWTVPVYFYAGGAAGAAATLAAVARASGGHDLDGLVERCRWISAAGTAIGTVCLIADLGRPERFLNMLRVFRPTSPLNVGSWLLTGATQFSVTGALLQRLGYERTADAAGAMAGVFGLPMSGYTAVLLSSTAVPVWQGARRSLPWLFVASAASSVGALLSAADLSERERRVAGRFGLFAELMELAATVAVEREAGRVERVARPLREGVSGTLWKLATACTVGGLAVSAFGSRSPRMRKLAAVVGTAGGLSLRFAIFHAGKASARDPRATFEQQRAGLGSAEVVSVT